MVDASLYTTAVDVVGPELGTIAKRVGLSASGLAASYGDECVDFIDTTACDLTSYDYVDVDILEFHERVLMVVGESPSPKHGFVYLVTDGDAVKIGKATNIEDRMKSLQTGNSNEIILLQAIEVDDMDRAEQSLHFWFRAYRKKGEWFDLLDLFGLDRMSCLRRAMGEKCLEFGYSMTVYIAENSCDKQPRRI